MHCTLPTRWCMALTIDFNAWVWPEKRNALSYSYSQRRLKCKAVLAVTSFNSKRHYMHRNKTQRFSFVYIVISFLSNKTEVHLVGSGFL